MKKYNVGWGITNACNMNCAFCYSKETRSKIVDVPIKEWVRFIDENNERIDSINYGTGESSMIDDFFSFIEYVRNKYPKITQSVTTNGYISQRLMNTPRLYDIFMNSIDEADISLDFATRDKHCEFRGQRYAYDWAVKTLEILKNTGKKATIVFVGFDDTLTKCNIDGLFSVARNYDALLRLNIYRPVSRQSKTNEKFMLKYNVLMSALEYINDKYRIIGLSDVLIGNIYSGDKNIKENTGINSIRILPDGRICPSTYLINEEYGNSYNIKDKNVLSKILYETFENAVIPVECHGCPIEERCRGGVYDRRILWYGTLKERDPYCPSRHNDSVIKKPFKIEKHERISVHDGYLPTLFFK